MPESFYWHCPACDHNFAHPRHVDDPDACEHCNHPELDGPYVNATDHYDGIAPLL